jgi:phosphoglycolate phosphatase-like HAD superfamily hydrolase
VTSRFGPRRLRAAQRAALLEELVAETQRRAGERAPSIVFDLDGTLMDNRPRVLAIMSELREHWRDRPEVATALAAASLDAMTYGFVDNLTALGITEKELHDEGLAFWSARFFTDDYVHHDVELPGAARFVRRLYDAGGNIIYLTGRDLPNMAVGTFASLRDLGFPIGLIGTELVTKPTFDMPDADFKRDVAAALGRLGPVLAVFDNEPANCNALFDAHPKCVSVLVDTLHAPSPPELDPAVRVIDNFLT